MVESDINGARNAGPTFVAMMTKLKMEWDTLDKERGLETSDQKLLLMMCYFMDAQ